MEKALWTHDGSAVGVNYFVSRLMAEYQFDFSMYYDKKLRQLYYSFDGRIQLFPFIHLSKHTCDNYSTINASNRHLQHMNRRS